MAPVIIIPAAVTRTTATNIWLTSSELPATAMM